MNYKKITWFEASVVALCAALFLWWLYPTAPIPEPAEETAAAPVFPEVSVEARSAYVLDAKTGGALYEKDPELQWPLASLTKLMVALAARSVVPDYLLVRITSDDIREEGDTGLLTDEEWNIDKLIDFSLMVSSNDGIRAIAGVAGAEIAAAASATSSAEKLFLDRMNSLAREIGMTETYFLNHSGLDMSKTLSGGYGSAKDMAVLLDHILKKDPHLLEATSFARLSIESKNKGHEAVNTNKALEKIPNVLASKTGYTELSGGNVVVAFNAGLDNPVIISILGSTYEGRFEDLNALVEATLRYFSEK